MQTWPSTIKEEAEPRATPPPVRTYFDAELGREVKVYPAAWAEDAWWQRVTARPRGTK